MRIKALRQFSHYHHGTFDPGETRRVSAEAGAALVGMGLAEEVGASAPEPPASVGTPAQATTKPRRGKVRVSP